jgi:rhamnosyltransferase
LRRVIGPLIDSPVRPRVLVLDSSSSDGTIEQASALGAETIVIPLHEFDHGATRERARHELATEIVVMVSQDAYPRPEALERLIAPIVNGEAALAYGRQLPRLGAGPIESFTREFNYPEESHTRDLRDAPRFGNYLVFCSNAFAAYRNTALDEIGGFTPTLSHEDAIAAARLLCAGHRIAYAADALVEHSHRSTLASEFRRSFDAGYAREQHRATLAIAAAETERGRIYATKLLAALASRDPSLVPYGVAHLASKWLGYFLGTRSLNAPSGWNRALSGHASYWMR